MKRNQRRRQEHQMRLNELLLAGYTYERRPTKRADYVWWTPDKVMVMRATTGNVTFVKSVAETWHYMRGDT